MVSSPYHKNIVFRTTLIGARESESQCSSPGEATLAPDLSVTFALAPSRPRNTVSKLKTLLPFSLLHDEGSPFSSEATVPTKPLHGFFRQIRRGQ